MQKRITNPTGSQIPGPAAQAFIALCTQARFSQHADPLKVEEFETHELAKKHQAKFFVWRSRLSSKQPELFRTAMNLSPKVSGTLLHWSTRNHAEAVIEKKKAKSDLYATALSLLTHPQQGN
jgi:hypothetical protein